MKQLKLTFTSNGLGLCSTRIKLPEDQTENHPEPQIVEQSLPKENDEPKEDLANENDGVEARNDRMEMPEKYSVDTDDEKDKAIEEDDDEDADEENGISEYERLRLQNIKRNQAFLETLGLNQVDFGRHVQKKNKKKSKTGTKRKRQEGTRRVQPQRSSRRLRGEKLDDQNPENNGTPQHAEEEEERFEYDNSAVFKYSLEPAASTKEDREGDCDGTRLRLASYEWEDTFLKKIYSIDAKGSMFAAGGHQGYVAVFGVQTGREGEVSDSLMSFKASKGWCSSVQFFNSETLLLLTASNDGVVSLWDLGQEEQTSGKAKQVDFADGLHDSGIFSLHYLGSGQEHLIATGSKDKTVALSTVRPSGVFEVVNRFELHEGVVKSVRLRDMNTVASTGNDQSVLVCDRRTGSKAAEILDAHDLVVNSVRWHPTNEHCLVTTSFTPEIKLFDIRNSSVPVQVLQSHSPSHVKRGKSIYHPIFLNDGNRILTTGECDQLTLYDTNQGTVLSRGEIGFQATTLHSLSGTTILASHGKTISSLTLCK